MQPGVSGSLEHRGTLQVMELQGQPARCGGCRGRSSDGHLSDPAGPSSPLEAGESPRALELRIQLLLK